MNKKQEAGAPKLKPFKDILNFSLTLYLGSFYFPLVCVEFNPYQLDVAKDGNWEFPLLNISLLTAAIPLGALIGSLFAGHMNEKYGRRKSLIYTDYLSMIGIIFCSDPNLMIMLPGKLMLGITVGVNSTLVPSYIQEITPREIYGTIISFHYVGIGLGLSTVYIFRALQISWKIVNFFPIVLVIMRSILLQSKYSMMESPFYLIQKNDIKGAEICLSLAYEEASVHHVIDEIQIQCSEDFSKQISVRTLFSPSYIRRFQVAVTLHLLQQFSGINAINFYSGAIFKQIPGLTPEEAEEKLISFSIIVGFVLAITGKLSGNFMDYFGRKKTLFIGCLFSGISLFLLAYCGFKGITEYNTMLMLSYMIFYGFSLGSVVWSYAPEIIPPLGCTLAAFCNWTSAFLIGLTFPFFVKTIGISSCFLFFSFVCFFGFVFIHYNVVETKGLMKDEIERLYLPSSYEAFSKELQPLLSDHRSDFKENKESFLKAL